MMGVEGIDILYRLCLLFWAIMVRRTEAGVVIIMSHICYDVAREHMKKAVNPYKELLATMRSVNPMIFASALTST